MSIDTKKVGLFLKYITDAEYLYLQHCIDIRNAANNLINRHNLSKEEFCKLLEIKPSKYTDFITGNYNYSVHDMACINAAFMELEAKKLQDEVPFKVAGS